MPDSIPVPPAQGIFLTTRWSLAGARLIESGSAFDALLHFAEALRLDAGHPDREEMHRRRFSAVLSTSPRLAEFRIARGVWNAQFSPDNAQLHPPDVARADEQEFPRVAMQEMREVEIGVLGNDHALLGDGDGIERTILRLISRGEIPGMHGVVALPREHQAER